MKKARIFMMIFIMLIMFLGITNTVFALGDGFDASIFNQINDGANVDPRFEGLAERIYGTIATIIKVVAMFGVVYTGVKYMTAGAGDKAAIKQTLIYVVIGTIFVFAADAVIGLLIKGGNGIIQ